MSNAKLPANRQRRSLGDIERGEEVWVIPSAMVADATGDCWINTTYSFSENEDPLHDMRVTRVEGGYSVDISKTDYNWHRRESVIDDAWMAPVVKIRE